MAVTVYIPTPFRRATNNKDRLQSAATTVGGLLDELEGAYTGLRGLVLGEGGQLHHHVNVYLNNEAIEALHGLATPLNDRDQVGILPGHPRGEPAYPAATYVVTSVLGGRPEAVAAFRWSSERRDFLPVDLEAAGSATEASPRDSKRLWDRAAAVMPGGVNSPVRAFRGVG